jgi:hypothetical protein
MKRAHGQSGAERRTSKEVCATILVAVGDGEKCLLPCARCGRFLASVEDIELALLNEFGLDLAYFPCPCGALTPADFCAEGWRMMRAFLSER